MQDLEYNFIILLYVSRSGSTFLAKQIADASSDVVVIPESRYLRTIAAHSAYSKEYNAVKLASLILEDPRFSGFYIEKNTVEKTLLNCRTHKEAGMAMTQLIIKSMGYPNTTNVLIKDGGFINYIDAVQQLYPSVRFLHIQRDPRACINSLLNTPKAFIKGNTSMGWNDIVLCSTQYKKYIDKVNTLEAAGNNVTTVQYEALITNTEDVVSNTLQRFGLSVNSIKSRDERYHLRKQESEIHKNVHKSAQKTRTDAWQTELKKWEKIYIEHELAAFIATPSVTPTKSELRRAKIRAKKNHFIASVKLNTHRVERYVLSGNFDLLLLKLKSRLSR